MYLKTQVGVGAWRGRGQYSGRRGDGVPSRSNGAACQGTRVLSRFASSGRGKNCGRTEEKKRKRCREETERVKNEAKNIETDRDRTERNARACCFTAAIGVACGNYAGADGDEDGGRW